MSRSSSSATPGDVMSFFSCVRFDPKLVDLDRKSNRPTDYKRHVSAALGILPDESPSSHAKGKQLASLVPEDIKRLRDGVHENFRRARDRAKMFSEALSRFNKDFPSITSKKRSRAENYSTDRSSFTLSDQSVLGPSLGKVGVHGHAFLGSFEHDQQKLEERTKTAAPNKRTRTSLVDAKMDVRSNSIVRSSGTIDNEKDIPQIANNGTVQGEERTFPIGGDGWEKSKRKKKRSGIKPGGSPSTTLTKAVNIFQETKQGMQKRLATDTRLKMSNDSHSFRTGHSNGSAGAGKSDSISQQAGTGHSNGSAGAGKSDSISQQAGTGHSNGSAGAGKSDSISQQAGTGHSNGSAGAGKSDSISQQAGTGHSNGSAGAGKSDSISQQAGTGHSNGSAGAGKSDSISQQAGLGTHVSTPRNDIDSNSAISDRRDRPVNSDKERVNFRATNKATVRDEFNSTSPNSSAKLNTYIRAPRSGSGVASKLSPVVPRATVPNDWELSNCTTTTKPPSGIGTNNRKRVASARSSSPPVVRLQRPQKSSRTARRTNFAAVVSSNDNDDSPVLDSVSDASGSDLGLGVSKRLSGCSPQQVRFKGGASSSAGLSESEKSGVAKVKPKKKGRKSDEIDQNSGQNVPKVSSMVPPTKKSKPVSRDEHGNGVGRHGRTGRNLPATRSLVPVTSEKLGNPGTVKQLRNSRLGFDKSEGKAGRSPTRKLPDQKAYARQKHTAISASADFHVGSEDGHEELLAAVKCLINSGHKFSSQFWRKMEPFFRLMIEEDIAYWKKKINLESNNCEAVANGFGLMVCERDIRPDAQRGAGIVREQLQLTNGDCNVIPLCQRLISALILEDGCSGSGDLQFNAYDTEFETNGEVELNTLDNHSLANHNFNGHSGSNGYRTTQKPENDVTRSDVADIPSNGLSSSQKMPIVTSSKLEYDALDMNDRLLLELQSIGISPEPVPEKSQTDDEGFRDDMTRLEEHYQREIFKKKGFLEGLLESASVTKECQEKDFEQRALDKLIMMAWKKYMACRGRNPSGGRNTNSTVAKQDALGFVKRTLERYHHFESTGKSCFNEPLFKDMFFAASSQMSVVRPVDSIEAESTKPHASSISLEARTGSIRSKKSHSQFSPNMNNYDANLSDIFPVINNSSAQTSRKDNLLSNRKKNELSLDDVGVSNAPSGNRGSPSSSTKRKRSERERDRKGKSREVQSRDRTTKVGRSASSNTKRERKPKSKPKQKAAKHSVSVNGLLGKQPDQPKPALQSVSKPNEMSTNRNSKEKNECAVGEDEHEAIDLSNLQLPGMDILDGQGQDIGSWLNIDDDDGLQDDGFMGLEIPMDDLSDLNIV